jgi:hypothetical protein
MSDELAGLALLVLGQCRRDMRGLPEMISPFGEFQPLTPTIITATSGISHCTSMHQVWTDYCFRLSKKKEKRKKKMKLGSVLS